MRAARAEPRAAAFWAKAGRQGNTGFRGSCGAPRLPDAGPSRCGSPAVARLRKRAGLHADDPRSEVRGGITPFARAGDRLARASIRIARAGVRVARAGVRIARAGIRMARDVATPCIAVPSRCTGSAPRCTRQAPCCTRQAPCCTARRALRTGDARPWTGASGALRGYAWRGTAQLTRRTHTETRRTGEVRRRFDAYAKTDAPRPGDGRRVHGSVDRHGRTGHCAQRTVPRGGGCTPCRSARRALASRRTGPESRASDSRSPWRGAVTVNEKRHLRRWRLPDGSEAGAARVGRPPPRRACRRLPCAGRADASPALRRGRRNRRRRPA